MRKRALFGICLACLAFLIAFGAVRWRAEAQAQPTVLEVFHLRVELRSDGTWNTVVTQRVVFPDFNQNYDGATPAESVTAAITALQEPAPAP